MATYGDLIQAKVAEFSSFGHRVNKGTRRAEAALRPGPPLAGPTVATTLPVELSPYRPFGEWSVVDVHVEAGGVLHQPEAQRPRYLHAPAREAIRGRLEGHRNRAGSPRKPRWMWASVAGFMRLTASA